MTNKTTISLPELFLIASTRVLLGVGLGLRVGERLNADQRKIVGRTLLIIGAVSTIPLALEVLAGRRLANARDSDESRVRLAA